MDSKQYREIFNRVDAFRISSIKQTISNLGKDREKEISLLESCISIGKVEKPTQHAAQSTDGFCLVKLSEDDVEVILESVSFALAESLEINGEASNLEDLIDKWVSYRESLQRDRPIKSDIRATGSV